MFACVGLPSATFGHVCSRCKHLDMQKIPESNFPHALLYWLCQDNKSYGRKDTGEGGSYLPAEPLWIAWLPHTWRKRTRQGRVSACYNLDVSVFFRYSMASNQKRLINTLSLAWFLNCSGANTIGNEWDRLPVFSAYLVVCLSITRVRIQRILIRCRRTRVVRASKQRYVKIKEVGLFHFRTLFGFVP